MDIDRETREAVAALVFRLRNREGADDEPFAQEFIAALKLRGWRPTEARPVPGWNRQHGGGAEPPHEALAAVRAQFEELNAAKRARLAALDEPRLPDPVRAEPEPLEPLADADGEWLEGA